MLQAAERAGLLVRQLLAFGRRQVLSLTIADLNQIVDGLMPMLRPVLGENITIECRREAPLDVVEADRSQIEQVLVNLCVNARDAMPEGGTLVVSTGNVLIDEQRREELALPIAGPYVRLQVEDSGCGMTPETQARVFEPFFTTKAPGHGTGLGLATVHGLVAQHRGAVHLDSEVGRGTRVAVYLPVAAAAELVAPAPAQRTVPGGNETILVAEDEPLVLELTRAFLEAAGYRVLTANTGVEALALIESRGSEIDLAVLDVVMPELGGEAVLRHLRERRMELPVLLASGYGRRLRFEESPTERVAFLQKPYGRNELLRKVRDLLCDSPPSLSPPPGPPPDRAVE